MMNKWFECKVKYVKTMENGLEKPVTETYLVDALSFTEAEKRFLEEIRPFMSGEFEVTSIKPVKFADVFYCDLEAADKWFKCKLVYITVDEKSVQRRRAPHTPSYRQPICAKPSTVWQPSWPSTACAMARTRSPLRRQQAKVRPSCKWRPDFF